MGSTSEFSLAKTAGDANTYTFRGFIYGGYIHDYFDS
jgi:hypothetical protein